MAASTAKKPVYLRGIPSDVIREAKALAARRGITLAGFVADTLARALREPDGQGDHDGDLSSEMRWFERNRERLSREFAGEYLAIIDAEVIDHDQDFDALAERVFAAHGARSVFMPRADKAAREVHVRSPRLRRRR